MTNKQVISKKSKNDEKTPRKKADTTLKESKELLAQAIDYAAIGMCLVSTDGYFRKVNKCLCELFGYTEAELLTKTFQEVTHPDDHKIGSDATKAMLSGKKDHVTFEKRYLKKNGPAFYAKVSSTLLKDDVGKPGFFFTQIEDITARKQAEEKFKEKSIQLEKQLKKSEDQRIANLVILNDLNTLTEDLKAEIKERKKTEEALRESEERYRQLFKGMLDAFAFHEMIFDKNGNSKDYRFIVVNPAFEKMTGLEGKDIIGKTVLEVMPDTEQYWIDLYGEVVKTREPKMFNNFSKELDRYYEGVVYSPEQGKFATIFQDVTERIRAQKALQQKEIMLTASQQLAKVGGWEYDQKTKKIFWTDETYRIHDYDKDQFEEGSQEHIAKSIECYLPEDREKVMGAFNNCVNKGIKYDLEFPFVTLKGRHLWVRTIGEPIYENGEIVSVNGTLQDITQLKHAQESLTRAAREWQGTFDAAQDGIWILDVDHHILQSNKEAEKIFKKSHDDLMNKLCFQNVHGTDEPIPECLFTRMKKTLKRESMELEIDELWLQVTVDPILDESGMLTGAVHIVRDITELKQSAQKVEELAKFPAENPNPVLRISKDGIVLYHNKASKPLLEKWDYQEGKPLKKKWFKIVHECLEDGVIKTYDIGIDDRVTTLTLAPIIEQDFVNIYGLDITERKKAEETLDIERRFSQNLIDTAQAVILLLDPNGKIVSFNPYMENLTGYKLDEVKGKDWFTTFLPKCEYDEIRILFKIALNETSTIGNVNPIMTKGGKEISIEWYDKVLKDRAGNITGLVSVGYDITERIKNENELEKYRKHLEELVDMRTEELQAANKELEAFAYSVSHDLRAPLRAINGFTSILMEDYAQKLDEEGKRIGALIQNNSRQMGQLIDDLLAFSRLGRASMQVSKIDMKSMVKAIYHEAANPEERKRVRFSIDDLPEVTGDPNMFRQVWMNLISNALKFSSKRDKAIITVSCNIEKNRFIFSIKDNGAGFNMKYKDKLFGVFQRLHTDREFPGTGVGLALVQRIILRHQGLIWAEGKVDVGATFYFSLPKK